MSIGAIGGSSSPYPYQSTSVKKKAGQDDPMMQAISQLQSTDPTLASKLSDMQKQVDAMKKNGSSASDIQKTIKSTMDGLSDMEKTELQSAMPKPPSGGVSHSGAHHHRLKASSDADSTAPSSSDTSSPFSLSSLLDTPSATQNDAILSLLSSRSATTASPEPASVA